MNEKMETCRSTQRDYSIVTWWNAVGLISAQNNAHLQADGLDPAAPISSTCPALGYGSISGPLLTSVSASTLQTESLQQKTAVLRTGLASTDRTTYRKGACFFWPVHFGPDEKL